MKKFKQLIHKIYTIVNKKRSNKVLIAQKNSSNKPRSSEVARNKHGFPMYLSRK